MILKINGMPVEEIIREGFGIVGSSAKEVYSFIHTPLYVEVSTDVNQFDVDANVFNIPHHAFSFIKPHIDTLLESLF